MAMGFKLFLFSAFIATTRQGGPECSSTTLITSSDVDILIDTSGIPCVRCVDSTGQGSRHTLYVIKGFMPMTSSDEVFPPGLYVRNDGVLMILDAASLIPAGSLSPFLFDCLDKPFLYTMVRLFSINLVPPTASPSSVPPTASPSSVPPTVSPTTDFVPSTESPTSDPTVSPSPEPVENIEQRNNCSGGNGTSLYFMMGDTRYESGSTLFITDVGASFARTGYSNPDASLVCMTENVNTQCCRQRDQGNMGEWYFPDGVRVPRNRNQRRGDFSRNGYHQQVRLNRRNDAVWPTGAYTCRVPEEGNLGCIHTASINLGPPAAPWIASTSKCMHQVVPPPREVGSFCMITIWKPPPGPFNLYSGYDVRFSHPKLGEIIFERENDEFFYLIDMKMMPDHLFNFDVQVRTKTDDDYSPWTEPIPACFAPK